MIITSTQKSGRVDIWMVLMNFIGDYAQLLRQRLNAAGYPASLGETDEDSITRYLNVLHRTVEPRPRKTKKSAVFSCPSALQDGLDFFIRKSEAGDNLRPHQSRKIEKADYDDGLFNDWGLHHFHLGISPDPKKPKLIAPTEPVLCAFVAPQTLYCLCMLKHGEWSNQKLLDYMHTSFPELTAGSSIKGVLGLSRNHSDEELAKLRSVGANVLTQRPDGTIMMGPGGGMTASNQAGKKSFMVSRAVDQVIITLEKMESAVRSKLSEAGITDVGTSLDLKLSESNGSLVAFDTSSALLFKFGRDIVRMI
jgi:hypothetical protein